LANVANDTIARPARTASLSALGLSALGVVFGDIGTSPLYTLKTVLGLTGGTPNAVATLGVLSLVVWTLIVITTIKYVSVAMRIDNDGEGGILALMSLLGVKRQHRPTIIAVGLFGAALIYGDGAITPAISVLSALEGLEIVLPAFAPYVLPLSVLILVALFAIQPQGTSRIGRAFGPIMALWFAVIALLGIWGIFRYPSVLVAIDPRHGLSYLISGGATGFLVLGGVFLCVTGAEALYADMGHFGAGPIRLAWSALVFPSLVLNYAGQAALVLDGAPISDNIFYRLCPTFLLLPLVVLATVATIIASQSIITGAFSMTRQAIQLGWLPRLHITQTSAEGYGPHLRHYADLACRSDRGLRTGPGCGCARRSLCGKDHGGSHPARARHRGLLDADPARRAAGHGLARQAQPGIAPEIARPDGHYGVGPLGQGH